MIFFLINLYFNIYVFLALKCYINENNIKKLKFKKPSIYNYMVVVMFFIVFGLILRIQKIFLQESVFFDLKNLLVLKYLTANLLTIFLLNAFFIILILVVLNKHLYNIINYNFMTLYYEYYHNTRINNVIKSFKILKIKFNNLFPRNFFFFKEFFFFHGFKIIIFISFIYDIIFNNFVLNLSFLPLYGLYHLLTRVYSKLNSLKFDFDIGIIILINDSYLVRAHGELKLELYKNYVITGKSDYKFFDYLDAKFNKQDEMTVFFDISKDTYL